MKQMSILFSVLHLATGFLYTLTASLVSNMSIEKERITWKLSKHLQDLRADLSVCELIFLFTH